MARFKEELPYDLIKDFEKLGIDTEKMLGEMTRAGAEITYKNVLKNVPKSFYGSNIMKCLKITRTYKTPSDDGINTKIMFDGYFINKKGIEVPAPLVCNVFEYGTSTKKKQSFMRKSFNKSQIEQEMTKVQEKYLPKE